MGGQRRGFAVRNTCNIYSSMQLRNSFLGIDRGQKGNGSPNDHNGYVLKSPDYVNPEFSRYRTDKRIAIIVRGGGARVSNFFSWGEREGIFGKFLAKEWGAPIFGPGTGNICCKTK